MVPYCGANGVLDHVEGYTHEGDHILLAEDGGHFEEFRQRPIAYRMNGYIWVNNHAHVIRAREGLDQGFLFWALVHKDIRPYLASGTRSKLNRSELDKIEVLHPSDRDEQRAIAQALTDADALIESLERLIEKKRRIKEGAMQELLTGKRRLPGFEGEWQRRTLGSLGSFLKGQGVSRAAAQSGDLQCVRYGEIYTMHHDVIRSFGSWIADTVAAGATRLRRGDILFAGSGETKEEIGKAAAFIGPEPAFAGGDIVILRPEGVEPTFLGYSVNQPEVVRQKASRGQGDAVVHISARALSEVELDLPPTIEEQAAVARLLKDMESELRLLQSRVEKARQFKEGMMQELLTGRIRLV